MRVVILIGPALLIQAACHDGVARVVQTEPDCVLIGPTVSPASATLHPGDTLRVHASYSPCPTGPAPSFRWRSSDTVTAAVDSLTGLVRARTPGQATVVATLLSEPTLKGAMALQVKQ